MTVHRGLTIVCLCAEWCGTCRDYRPLFDSLAASLRPHRFSWVDIEDQADLAGDVDVETFPTLLIADGEHVLFAGPVLPRLADTQRLIATLWQNLQDGDAPPALRMPADQLRAFRRVAQSLHAS